VDGFQTQPDQEPGGAIVQPDEAVHVPAGTAVVPWADTNHALQQPARQVLHGPEAQHVDNTPQRPGPGAEGVVDGFVQRRDEAIEGKHPQIGRAPELPASLLPAELLPRRRPDDLAAPAEQSVDDESNGHVALSFPPGLWATPAWRGGQGLT
jgi:hypothetical protein